MYLPLNIAVICIASDFVDEILEAYEAAMSSMLKSKYISEISIISENALNKIAKFNNTESVYDRQKDTI